MALAKRFVRGFVIIVSISAMRCLEFDKGRHTRYQGIREIALQVAQNVADIIFLFGCKEVDGAPILASQSVLRCAGVGVQMDID